MKNFNLYLAGGSKITANKTLVMGILNATPDSFSDGGELSSESVLKKRISQMIKNGADLLDVGGESTRPGHSKVGSEQELKRILPVIKTIRQISKTIPVSIDTQKASVADAALNAGASLINDVSALGDPRMASVVNGYNCSIILMRNQGLRSDPIAGCRQQFKEIIANAGKQGIKKERILLDPGLGFGDLKTGNYKIPPGSDPKANVLLILNVEKYSQGLPVVIGASRKRFIGDISGVEEPDQRLVGSVAAAIMAKEAGAAIVRVHDVAETIKAFKNLDYL